MFRFKTIPRLSSFLLSLTLVVPLAFCWASGTPGNLSAQEEQQVDLSQATVVNLSRGRILTNAAEMLRDEIEKRTRIRLVVENRLPVGEKPVVVLGTRAEHAGAGLALAPDLEIPAKADGYALWVDTTEKLGTAVHVVGHDDRGALFGAGRLLRLLLLGRDRISLDRNLQLATSPRYSLRGHQMGYRAKTNAYDAWTVEMWEQYFRDMIVFGMNAVELVPPKTDDHFDSPHFPLPPLDMMIQMSRLADDYGLDVWIWYPHVVGDLSDPMTMSSAMRESDRVFSRLPRVDAVFVPSGDPSEIHPDQLFPLMKNLKQVLHRYHPQATIWSSVQNYDDEPATMGWIAAFYEKLRGGQVDWFDGVVFGPATETTLPEMRRNVPEGFPIRRYPDITHSKNCQYEVDDWDPAYQRTEGREVINPRPRAYARIFRELQQYSFGSISYSEGCNDDVNKVVWSVLGWDPDTPEEEILIEYSRYFVGPGYQDDFSDGLIRLEENWKGSLLDNTGVYSTLDHFRRMESRATPAEKLNWRFQQGLYRAYYDAYVKARLEYETELERRALSALESAGQTGSFEAMRKAESILDQSGPEAVKPEWRARIFELGEALFQSIRMQLSVPKYQAKQVGRGANLDLIDVPLNNSRQLKEMFAEIRMIDSETERLEKTRQIVSGDYEKIEYDWEDIVEMKLREADPLWYIRRSADDIEHGPVARTEFRHGDDRMSGLIGFRNDKPDFEDDPVSLDFLQEMDRAWPSQSSGWAAYWTGYVEAPHSGLVTFTAEADDGIRLAIDEMTVIEGLSREPGLIGRVRMEKGRIYPIRLWYYQVEGPSYLRLYWNWEGQDRKIVEPSALTYGPENRKHAQRYLE